MIFNNQKFLIFSILAFSGIPNYTIKNTKNDSQNIQKSNESNQNREWNYFQGFYKKETLHLFRFLRQTTNSDVWHPVH